MTLEASRHSGMIEFQEGGGQPVTYDVVEFGSSPKFKSGIRYVIVHDYHLPLEMDLLTWVKGLFPEARPVHQRLSRRISMLVSNDPENFVAVIP